MLRCEVCGCKIREEPNKVIIEGAKLTVCNRCSKHGKIVYEEPKKLLINITSKPERRRLKVKTQKTETRKDTDLEFVDNFGLKIRKSRKKLELSQEELGKKIGEKVSIIKKLETEKIRPDDILTLKLERVLKIKLLDQASVIDIAKSEIYKKSDQGLTIGDFVVLNNSGEDKKKRK